MTIDGKAIAAEILDRLTMRIGELPFRPILCDVIVGDDSVSLSYVNIKKKTAEQIGVEFRMVQLPATASDQEVTQAIKVMQKEPRLCGLIVQLPLPPYMDKESILQSIDPEVDVDSINPLSAQMFYDGRAKFVPPTAGAIVHILDWLKMDYTGKIFLVAGQGELVGKPTTYLLNQRNYRVLIVDQSTGNLAELMPQADIIVSGTGQANLIRGDMIKAGAVIIDAGTSETNAGIVGDIDFESVQSIAAIVSPVPGGVGPVTVAKLLENVVQAAETKRL